MQVRVETVEKATISYLPSEAKEALEYCSQGKYKIVNMYAVRDGRSGHYAGEVIISAERMAGGQLQ